MKIANSLSNYSLNDIGRIDVKTALPSKDQKNPFRVGIATTAADTVKEQVARSLGIIESKEKPLVLNVTITRCTEGNRAGRIFAGELGAGWAMLFLDWRVIDTASNEVIIGGKTEKFKDSGAAGFADMFEADLGQKALQEMASHRAPTKIAMNVKGAFQMKSAA